MKIQKESTKEKPFGFFEYFIQTGFFLEKKNFFIGLEELGVPIVEHDLKKEYYCIPTFDIDGNETIRKITFRGNVSALMECNYKKSLKIIKDNIEETYLSLNKVSNYLLFLINDLSLLIDKTKKNQTLIDYQIDLQLYRLLILIYENYKLYLNRIDIQPINDAYFHLKLDEERKVKEEKIKNKAEQNTLRSFKWIKPNYYLSVYNLLIEEHIIHSNQHIAANFFNAFSGIPITEPPKIIWRLKSKKSDLAPLVRFLNFLMSKGFIEEVNDNAQFAHMVENLFLNHEGKPFKDTIIKTKSIKLENKELAESRLQKMIDELQPDTEK